MIRYELNKILRFQPSTMLLCLAGADIISSYLSMFADGQSSRLILQDETVNNEKIGRTKNICYTFSNSIYSENRESLF